LKASLSKPCEETQDQSDHKENCIRLADIDEQFQHSLELKEAASKKAHGDVIELAKVLENMQKIAKEKSSIEKELKWKEQEYRQLSELKEKDELFFQMKIKKKRKKIKKLKTKLQAKEQELKSAQQEARMQQEELLKAEAEVEKKHEEVKQLQREREELAHAYNAENLKVSKRIQSTVVATSSKEMKVSSSPLSSYTQCILCTIYSNANFMSTKPISLSNKLLGHTMHAHSYSSHLIS